MAEIMEEKKELTPAETAVPTAPETPKEAEKSPVSKKKRRRMIRRIIALVIVAALIAGGVLCALLVAVGGIFCTDLLHLINTPDNVLADSKLYLDIYIFDY